MKYALISPNEKVETGFRVAQISDEQFEVASPIFWKTCPTDVEIQADGFWYNPVTEEFINIPVIVPENKSTTVETTSNNP